MTLKIPIRNTGADDNLCEKIVDNDCSNCNGCARKNDYFEINVYKDFFTVGYFKKIGDINMLRFSERINKDFTLWGEIGEVIE